MKKYYEEFEPGHTRHTSGRTITETDIVLHAGQTGDFFPHHMDEAWCNTQPFKHRIAHGTLIFSVAIGLTADLINEVSMTYGYDRLRFIRPVYIGDTNHLSHRLVRRGLSKPQAVALIWALALAAALAAWFWQ